MNAYFDQLRQVMADQLGVDEARLIDALYMVRAPYSLQAIVPCCRHLALLYRHYPAILSRPAFPDQAERLAALQQIANLTTLSDHFLYAHVESGTSGAAGQAHPIYGYSGDSGLAELLVAKPPDVSGGVDPLSSPVRGISVDERAQVPAAQHRRVFTFLRAWFAFQTFHHQAQRGKRDRYVQYITGDGKQRLKDGAGSRLYGASLAVRRLADPKLAGYALQIARLLWKVGLDHSGEAATVLTRAAAKDPVRRMPRGEAEDAAARTAVELRQAGLTFEGIQLTHLSALARLLRYVWQGDTIRVRVGEGHSHGTRGAASIRIYPDALAITTPTQLGGDQPSSQVDLYSAPPGPVDLAPTQPVNPRDNDDDPAVEEPVEPVVSVYLVLDDNYFGRSHCLIENVTQWSALPHVILLPVCLTGNVTGRFGVGWIVLVWLDAW